MNTYRYSIPVVEDGDKWFQSLHIGMTPYNARVFNYCLRHNQKGPLSDFYRYLKDTVILADDRVLFVGEVNDVEPDYIFEYIPVEKVYEFTAGVLDGKERIDSVSLYIKINEVFFDRFNDNANLGDIPMDLNEIIEKKVREYERDTGKNNLTYEHFLECERECKSDHIDYEY